MDSVYHIMHYGMTGLRVNRDAWGRFEGVKRESGLWEFSSWWFQMVWMSRGLEKTTF